MKKFLSLIAVVAIVIPAAILMTACGGGKVKPLDGMYDFTSFTILGEKFVSRDFVYGGPMDVTSNGKRATNKVISVVAKAKQSQDTTYYDEFIAHYETTNDVEIAEELEGDICFLAGMLFFDPMIKSVVGIEKVDDNYYFVGSEMVVNETPAGADLSVTLPDDLVILAGSDEVDASWNKKKGEFYIQFKAVPTASDLSLMMDIVMTRSGKYIEA